MTLTPKVLSLETFNSTHCSYV